MTTDLFKYIEDNTIRLEASHRGGGIEIDATEYLGYNGRYELRMTAYQNYLGGGMTGSIQAKAVKLNEALKRYFYNVTNDIVEDWDEWAASESFEAQQARPTSAY